MRPFRGLNRVCEYHMPLLGKDQDPLEPVQRPAAVELDRHELFHK